MNLYAVVHGDQWTLSTSRKRAMDKARETGEHIVYKRTVHGREMGGWDQPTFTNGAELIYMPRQFADPLRTVRLAPYRKGMGPTFTLRMGATNERDWRGQTTIEYELTMHENGRSVIVFSGADFHCSPMHADDSNQSVAGLLGFLTLQPGDREYFNRYTPAQLAFAESHGQDLALAAIGRFGEQ